ncbi:FAS1-like dehydratase domain-containing protein [Actinopolymorpha alba]|uniref:FAS1-like dehydratase domain-containing protein n=1 Tax=Actinopolymorpha alba TaxID=533267 RepID=UPI00035F9104|nr:MaoC family dehydratase N-terminal domain-containing protein [Actinopolymorpha alba]
MPVDALVGRAYSTRTPYEVGREKIREFADAIGDPNPVYRDPEVAKAFGHTDVVAPPTFPIVVAFGLLNQLFDDPEAGVALHRVVHADQKFSYTRPLHPGDRLAATLTVEGVRQVAGADLILTRTAITTVDGEPVCTASASIVHRGEAEA